MKQIEGFCRLAETLNFSRAASMMYMSQPAFSRMIASLEEELGCALFIRDKQNPRLTPAGEELYPKMKMVGQLSGEIMRTARLAREDKLGRLRIGILDSGVSKRNRAAVRAFREQHPHVQVSFEEFTEVEIFNALEADLIDVALAAHFPDLYRSSIEGLSLNSSVECVVFNRNNPLADREEVSIMELEKEPFIAMRKERSQYGYGNIMNSFLRHGFFPQIVMEADSLFSALSAVDCGLGCTILPQSMHDILKDSHVVFVPLKEGKINHAWLLWRRDSTNPQIRNFLQVMEGRWVRPGRRNDDA
ncbi:MAG: LysR family transcriptional regulator [Emergencia sp.]